MKLSATLPLLCVFTAGVSAGNFFQQLAGSREMSIDTDADLKVPGDSPLSHCGAYDTDLVDIHRVDLTPNPPVCGDTLNIEAEGDVKEQIDPGAQVELWVKVGPYVTIIHQTFDMCDNVDQVDLECPIKKGKLVLKKSVEIPSQVPPGTYNVQARAYTKDGKPITCLKGGVTFS